MQKNKVIIIAGPTASGKSHLAMDIALAKNGVVINADSMQVYKDTPVLSACPSADDKKKVAHRLYEIYPSSKNGTVVDWLDLAVAEIRNCWAEGRLPVVAGGTGLYIDNLINGTTPIPETKIEIKKKVSDMLWREGVQFLHKKLVEIDPVTASRLSENDTTRVCRALEVYYDTGVSLSEWHKKPMIKKIEADFAVIKILPSKKELDVRIDFRLDKMVEQGAVEEVKALEKQGLNDNLPAMKALGVPELLSFVRGEVSLEKALSLAKVHTRQYAKRQLTWFRNKLQAQIIINEIFDYNSNLLSIYENIDKK